MERKQERKPYEEPAIVYEAAMKCGGWFGLGHSLIRSTSRGEKK